MITKKIKIKFEIGSTVFSKTDPDQYERQITGITLRPTVFCIRSPSIKRSVAFTGLNYLLKSVLKSKHKQIQQILV
jgi:hypothetical protein